MVKCPICGEDVSYAEYMKHYESHQEAGGLRPTVVRDGKRVEGLVTPEAASFRRETSKLDRWQYHGDIGDYFKEPLKGISEVSGFEAMSQSLAYALKASGVSPTEERLVVSEFWNALNRKGWVHNEEVDPWVKHTQGLL